MLLTSLTDVLGVPVAHATPNMGSMAVKDFSAVYGKAAQQNPAQNWPVTPDLESACVTLYNPAACVTVASKAIDAARASEGVGPLSLPADFLSLDGADQLFVLTNLERVDRGIYPLDGVTPDLNDYAAQAAADNTDPVLPNSYQPLGGNWAGVRAPIFADFLWMYADGPGSTNVDCPYPGARGCWGHRDNILNSTVDQPPNTFGGAVAGPGHSPSLADVFVVDDTTPPVVTWNAFLPTLLPNLSAPRVVADAPVGGQASGTVVVSASGRSQSVSATVSGQGWSLATSLCNLAPGQSCPISVHFGPERLGDSPGTLVITSDGGARQTVPLAGQTSGGYQTAAADGGIFNFGGTSFYGSVADIRLNRPVVSMVRTPDQGGYWLAAADGGVFCFGDAQFHGSGVGRTSGQAVVAMASTPDGQGYWLVTATGAVLPFGDAQFYGSLTGLHLNSGIVGMGSSPDGGGYWLVGGDGGVFTFGDAGFYGSAGSYRLKAPIVGMSATADGAGYWLVAADGGVFTFGDAPFYGSTGSMRLNAPMVAISPVPTGGGYWLVAADGGVFTFGDAPFYGSTGGMRLNAPVVASSP